MYALLRLIIWRRFTNVGRRVGLVQVSRKAADELQNELRIIGADITADAPALYFCDEPGLFTELKIATTTHIFLLFARGKSGLLNLENRYRSFAACGEYETI